MLAKVIIINIMYLLNQYGIFHQNQYLFSSICKMSRGTGISIPLNNLIEGLQSPIGNFK